MPWPAGLRPADFRQPDGVSCGAASLLAARALLGEPMSPDPAAEIRQLHRRLTRLWPRALGTPPWAAARQLRALTGIVVRTHVARWRRDVAWQVLWHRVGKRPTAVYVGNRWLPRHVVLAVEVLDGDTVRVLDPGSGALRALRRDAWLANGLGLSGWTHPWLVV